MTTEFHDDSERPQPLGLGSSEGLAASWRSEPAPTHRCKVCGGLWRFWRHAETPGATGDSWNMRSQCFDCCADAPMGDQIEPLTLGRMEQYLRARLAVDAMVQHMEGPQAGDSVQ